MGATLNTAQASEAYVLSDRGTWIHFKNKGDLGASFRFLVSFRSVRIGILFASLAQGAGTTEDRSLGSAQPLCHDTPGCAGRPQRPPEFATVDSAEASGRKLKAAYPMLQIEIYDADKKVRTLLA